MRITIPRLIAASALAAVVGVAGASAIVSQDGSDIGEAPSTIHPDGRGSRIAATTRDPESQRLWGIRVYGTLEGQTCGEVGRVQDGVFGQYEDGSMKFVPQPVQGGGSCTDFKLSPVSVGVVRFGARPGHAARSFVAGVVTNGIRSLELRTIAGTRDLPIEGGAYVAIVDSAELASAGAAVSATMEDGSVQRWGIISPPPKATETLPTE